MWTEKYRPRKEEEVIGQERQKEVIKRAIEGWNQNSKPLLLHGPPGVGKTSYIHALAKQNQYEILEVNASDTRSKENLHRIIGQALAQRSLFGGKKLILIDEVDGIGGSKERGGMEELIKLLENPSTPVVLTANDIEDEKMEKLRTKIREVPFERLETAKIAALLWKIVKKENIKADEKSVKKIARQSRGDVRGAITDLQTSKNEVGEIEALDEETTRRQKEEIKQAVKVVLKTKKATIARQATENIDQDIIDLSRKVIGPVIFGNDDAYGYWIEENIPKEYDKGDIEKAFEVLSRADVFRGRIMRRQYYGYLTTIQMMLTAGVAISKSERSEAQVRYSKTERSPKQNKKLWWLVTKKREAIVGKIAHSVHSSKRKVKEEFGMYKQIIKEDPLIAEKVRLSEDEVNYLRK